MTIPSVTGVNVEVQADGVGTRETKAGDTISVHYRGTLTNGKLFDSSYDRGQPLSFTAGDGQVIQGWDQGLIGMKIGEKRKLTIEPAQAYGSRGVGGVIPPNATLIFETELTGIKGVVKGQ